LDYRRLLAVGAVLASAALPGLGAAHASEDTPYRKLARLFEYDRQPAPRFRVESEREEQGVHIQDGSFPASGLRLHALLLVPGNGGRHPGVVIAPEGVGDRTNFLDEGIALARRGAVVLLLDGPWQAANIFGWPTCTKRDRREVIRSVIEMRRGIDLLTRRPEVAPDSIAVVGFSYSAWTTGILAGVDRRPRSFVLESGEATMTRFATGRCGGGAYRDLMRPFDPVLYVGHARKAALLFQNARFDQYWTRPEMVALYRAAKAPKTIRWYDADHSLNAAAMRDRIAWLAKRLALPG
jgi:dienelactone hydrolase